MIKLEIKQNSLKTLMVRVLDRANEDIWENLPKAPHVILTESPVEAFFKVNTLPLFDLCDRSIWNQQRTQ